jgi:hypothetical protein
MHSRGLKASIQGGEALNLETTLVHLAEVGIESSTELAIAANEAISQENSISSDPQKKDPFMVALETVLKNLKIMAETVKQWLNKESSQGTATAWDLVTQIIENIIVKVNPNLRGKVDANILQALADSQSKSSFLKI